MRMNRQTVNEDTRQDPGKHTMYDLNCLPHSTTILSIILHKQPSRDHGINPFILQMGKLREEQKKVITLLTKLRIDINSLTVFFFISYPSKKSKLKI